MKAENSCNNKRLNYTRQIQITFELSGLPICVEIGAQVLQFKK